jgi:hypothetical protein
MANINAKLPKSKNSMCLIQTIGARRMAAQVVLGQCLQVLHQSSLKYYQVVAQVAHQVVTMTTALAVQVAVME